MTNVSGLRPVASIITAWDAAHALELANDSEFGLASTIYTSNVELAQKLAGEPIINSVGWFADCSRPSAPCRPSQDRSRLNHATEQLDGGGSDNLVMCRLGLYREASDVVRESHQRLPWIS